MKAKITITAVVEYEINPKYYPSCTTPDEMLAQDVKSADAYPFDLLEGDDVVWAATGELVK